MLLEISLELLKDVGAFAGCIVAIGGAVGLIWGLVKKPFNRLDNRFNRIDKKFDEQEQILKDSIDDAHKESQLASLRLEINQLIHWQPENEDTIYRVYEEYKELGGNHYIDTLMKRWEESRKEAKTEAKEKSKE